jgi:tetratricopeptide (TPR) repeat protein
MRLGRAFLAPAAIFALALLIRLAYVYDMMEVNPLFSNPVMDEAMHDSWARGIVSGEFPGDEPFFRAPLYYYLLALVYKVSGPGYLLPRILQALIGSLTCVLIYELGRMIFDRRTALVAGLAAAVYWIFIFFDGELLITSLAVFLNVALLLSLYKAMGSSGGLRWILPGILFGLSALARPNILVFLPAVVVIAAFPWKDAAGRRSFLPGRAAGAVLWVVLGAAMIILPVTIRNYLTGNDFVLISSQGGVNFYIGNNPAADGVTAIVPGTSGEWLAGYHQTQAIAERARGRNLKPSQISSYWFERSLDFIQKSPIAWLRLVARKTFLFLKAGEINNNKPIRYFKEQSRVLRWPLLGYAVIAPLGLFGMLFHGRHRRPLFPLYAYFFLYSAGVILFFVNARFRVPVIPVLIVFAAAGLGELQGGNLSRNRTASLVGKLVLLALLFLAVNVRLGDHEAASRFDRASGHFLMGLTFKEMGEISRAEEWYRRATETYPGHAAARNNLAGIYIARGEWHKAGEELRWSLKAEPRNGNALVNAGFVWFQLGDTPKAKEFFERALEGILSREMRARALYNLGMIFSAEGKLAEAEKSWREAVFHDPSHALARHNLALMAKKRRELEGAIEGDGAYEGALPTLPDLLDLEEDRSLLRIPPEP